MKEVTTMSCLTNQLEKMFRALNADFFDNALEMPVITVVPSSRSYAHYTPWSAWQTKDTHKREINIASGTLNRPLEAIAASLLHEAVHYYNDTILNIQDCSRNNSYHNKYFKQTAEEHGLVCTKTEKYGFSKTTPSDRLLEWLLVHDEFREIEMCRINPEFTAISVSTGNNSTQTPTKRRTVNTSRYICPCCGLIVKAPKDVNIICGDCVETMMEG